MRKLYIILALAFGPAVIAACFAFLMPQGGTAYNTYVNEYRKWPWRAGASHTITTLPHQGEHATNPYIAEDIDVGGSFKVHSSSSRGIVRKKFYAPDDNEDGISGGWTLDIQEEDGAQYHVYYLHLNPDGIHPWEGKRVFQGEWIATSSNSGCSVCGTHLHFGMSTLAYGDGGDNISIFPLAGYTGWAVPTATPAAGEIGLGYSYDSDNGGIGDICNPAPCLESTELDGSHYSAFTTLYALADGYNGAGVTYDYSPYGITWWVYPWNTESGYSGVAQNFIGGTIGQGAIMQGDGLGAYWVYKDFWYAYATAREGTDNWWIAYIGYPTAGRDDKHCDSNFGEIQVFENGSIFTTCDPDDQLYIYVQEPAFLHAQSLPVATPTPVPTRHPMHTPMPDYDGYWLAEVVSATANPDGSATVYLLVKQGLNNSDWSISAAQRQSILDGTVQLVGGSYVNTGMRTSLDEAPDDPYIVLSLTDLQRVLAVPATPVATPANPPVAVGGIVELPDIAESSAGRSSPALAVVMAGVVVLLMGGSAWYTRRRRG